MNKIKNLADEIIFGRRLSRNDDLKFIIAADLDTLCSEADRIRTELCGNHASLCTIINARSGKCSENCKFCAQSACHNTGISEYGFLDEKEILAECRRNAEKGIHRFSVVTAGRALTGKDFNKAISIFKTLKNECNIGLCASLGLLNEEQFAELYQSGVRVYHCNLETSRRNFPNICTTHTYDDKIACIKSAQKCGLSVCSGGIIGMGESWEDRLDMALDLAELNIRSIPINVLKPIKGTPLGGVSQISKNDIIRTVAMFRFIIPEAFIRLAAGRETLGNSGEQAFRSGANAAITGDMLTTTGSNIRSDIEMLEKIGFEIS